MSKKTWLQKLNSPGDLPKVEDLSQQPDKARKLGGMRMLIAAPLQYHQKMAKVPLGKLTTTAHIRAQLAAEAGADLTCPLTAGIFVNIAARASVEQQDASFGYWRTLKSGGELNEKYPEGIEGQSLRLMAEGHQVIQRGKRSFVIGYEDQLADLK